MSLAVAMVALPRVGPVPAPDDLDAWLAVHAQGMPRLTAATHSPDGLAAAVGDAVLAIGLMPAPIPWSELEGPCSTAYWWPEAARVLKAHEAHLIVAVKGGDVDAIQRNLQLTSVVAAILATGDASGAYWGAGAVVMPPEIFIEAATSMSRELLPLDLWIDFRAVREEDGSTSLFTTGLEDLGHMDLEISRWNVDPGAARESAWNVAHYLLDQGPVLNDGDSIGFDPDEKLRIRHLPSMWNPEKTVIRLEL